MVLIDTPAQAVTAGVEAARVADFVGIPTTIEPLAIDTLAKVNDILGLAETPWATVYTPAGWMFQN